MTNSPPATGKQHLPSASLNVALAMLAIVLALTVWATTDGRTALASLAFLALLIPGRTILAGALLSPVQIVSCSLFSLAILGGWLYDDVADAAHGGGIRLMLSQETTNRTALLMICAAVAVLLGGVVSAAMLEGARGKDEVVRPFQTISAGSLRRIALVAPLPLVLLLMAYGPGDLVHRDLYIAQHVGSNPLLTLASTLCIPAIAALGYLWGTRSSQLWVVILLAAYTIAFVGLGSRRLALVPILFAIGIVAARMDRRSKVILGSAAMLSVYSIGFPLDFRALPEHGIQPYFAALPDILGHRFPWEDIGRNLLIGFALIGQTAFEIPQFPSNDMVVALNPLPGPLSGWYDIADSHRLNTYTPTAGLGELGNFGWTATIIVCLGIGLALGILERRAHSLLRNGNQFLGLALILLSVLFVLFFSQYNLRAAVRMIYYGIALGALANMFTLKTRKVSSDAEVIITTKSTIFCHSRG